MAHVALRPGAGRVARFASAAVFVPADAVQASTPESLEQLLGAFERGTASAERTAADQTAEPGDAMNLPAAAVPFALIDWSALTSPAEGPWPSGSGVRVVVAGDIRVVVSGGHVNETVIGSHHRVIDSVVELAQAISVDIHVSPTSVGHAIAATPAQHTELVAGVVPAESMSLNLSTPASLASGRPIELADEAREWGVVDPPQFDEVVAQDNTLTPLQSVTWPDESEHRNDATQRRAQRPHPTALALQMPDGVLVPVDTTLLIGREPDPRAAQLAPGAARPVTVNAPTTVSRTHLVVRKVPTRNDRISVTDCGSRGSTAVLSPGDTEPHPLTAWQPHDVSAGDRVLLGGPTAITVVGIASSEPIDDRTLDAGATLSPPPGGSAPSRASQNPEAHR